VLPADPAPVEVRPSPIAGRGLFAATDIDTGVVVAGPMNHSCDPNTWFVGRELVTRRPIAADEELTYDYATGTTDLTLYCHCETYRCRQLVDGDDWRIPQLQQRYAGHFAPEVQKLIDAAQ
jgi:SET domain-containing protein